MEDRRRRRPHGRTSPRRGRDAAGRLGVPGGAARLIAAVRSDLPWRLSHSRSPVVGGRPLTSRRQPGPTPDCQGLRGEAESRRAGESSFSRRQSRGERCAAGDRSRFGRARRVGSARLSRTSPIACERSRAPAGVNDLHAELLGAVERIARKLRLRRRASVQGPGRSRGGCSGDRRARSASAGSAGRDRPDQHRAELPQSGYERRLPASGRWRRRSS